MQQRYDALLEDINSRGPNLSLPPLLSSLYPSSFRWLEQTRVLKITDVKTIEIRRGGLFPNNSTTRI